MSAYKAAGLLYGQAKPSKSITVWEQLVDNITNVVRHGKGGGTAKIKECIIQASPTSPPYHTGTETCNNIVCSITNSESDAIAFSTLLFASTS